ncbi:MAG: hypothetical protein E7590_09995 [Ruminococcaceae bacterium]|nr:hypothetical protein [Oscillospiraceae bacterium]
MSIENVGGSAFKSWSVWGDRCRTFRSLRSLARKNGLPAKKRADQGAPEQGGEGELFVRRGHLRGKTDCPQKSEQIKAHRSKGAKANFSFVEVTCEEKRIARKKASRSRRTGERERRRTFRSSRSLARKNGLPAKKRADQGAPEQGGEGELFVRRGHLREKTDCPQKSEQIKAHRSKGAKANFSFVEVTCEEQHRYAMLFYGQGKKKPNVWVNDVRHFLL